MLALTWKSIFKADKENLFILILPSNSHIPPPIENYPISLFFEIAQKVLMILILFGEDDTKILIGQALGLLSMMLFLGVILNIPSHLIAKSINIQFHFFHMTRYFIYPSISIHFFIYVKVDKFNHLSLNMMECI